MIDFIQYQKDLDDIIGDTRDKWLPDLAGDDSKGVALKGAINYGLRETLNRIVQNATYLEKNYHTQKLTISAGEVSRPSDILRVYKIYVDGALYWDFTDQETEGKILFPDYSSGAVILQYIPKHIVLSANADEGNVNDFFSESVLNYAMEKYHTSQEDWDNVSRMVAYAEDKIEDLLNKYY